MAISAAALHNHESYSSVLQVNIIPSTHVLHIPVHRAHGFFFVFCLGVVNYTQLTILIVHAKCLLNDQFFFVVRTSAIMA